MIEKGKDYQESQAEVSFNDAVRLVHDAAVKMKGKRPTALLTLAMVVGFGIDQFGIEFVRWDKKEQDVWLQRMVYKLSKFAVEEGVEMEKEGLAGSLKPDKETGEINGGLMGKEIRGV